MSVHLKFPVSLPAQSDPAHLSSAFIFSLFFPHYLLLWPLLLFGGLYAWFKELWSLDCGMASFLLSLSLENPPEPPGSSLGCYQAAIAFWYTSQLSLLVWKVTLWSDNPCMPLLYFQSAPWREPGKGALEPLPALRALACLRIALAFAKEFEHCIKHSYSHPARTLFLSMHIIPNNLLHLPSQAPFFPVRKLNGFTAWIINPPYLSPTLSQALHPWASADACNGPLIQSRFRGLLNKHGWGTCCQNGHVKGNTLLLGQYCLCVPPWKPAAVVCGNAPTWVIAFCLLLASLVGLRQLTLHVFFQIKQRGLLLALLFAEAMCGREAPSRKSLRKPGHGCLLHPSCGVGALVSPGLSGFVCMWEVLFSTLNHHRLTQSAAGGGAFQRAINIHGRLSVSHLESLTGWRQG